MWQNNVFIVAHFLTHAQTECTHQLISWLKCECCSSSKVPDSGMVPYGHVCLYALQLSDKQQNAYSAGSAMALT
jgi:hypothetical protein